MTDLGLKMEGGMLQRIPPTASKEEQATILNDIIDRLNNILKVQVFSDVSSKRFLSGYQKAGWPGGDFGIKVSPAGVDVTAASFKDLLFAHDFTTGIQYYNVDGKTFTIITPSYMKVAKEGYDAETASNDQLVFNSAQNVFKIVADGIITLPQMAAAGGSFETSSASLDTGVSSAEALVIMGFIDSSTSTGRTALPYIREQLDPVGSVGGIGYKIEIGTTVDGGTVRVNASGTNYQPSARGPFDLKYYLLQESAE